MCRLCKLIAKQDLVHINTTSQDITEYDHSFLSARAAATRERREKKTFEVRRKGRQLIYVHRAAHRLHYSKLFLYNVFQ